MESDNENEKSELRIMTSLLSPLSLIYFTFLGLVETRDRRSSSYFIIHLRATVSQQILHQDPIITIALSVAP